MMYSRLLGFDPLMSIGGESCFGSRLRGCPFCTHPKRLRPMQVALAQKTAQNKRSTTEETPSLSQLPNARQVLQAC